LIASAVAVLKARVTGTAVLFVKRSPSAIVMTTSVGDVCAVVVIEPDATPADAVTSASVCTVMPVALPALTTPIVKPLRVMVKAVFAAMPATAVVMTMEVAPGAAEVAVIPATDVEPARLFAGVAVVAKNPAG
jgi:hypothetical protein